MKLPLQAQSVARTVSTAQAVVANGVQPSLAGLLGGMLSGGMNPINMVVDTGMGLAKTIGCPIACANNDQSAIRALSCKCGG